MQQNGKMTCMITGGNSGLGLVLAQRFNADSYSRHNGYDIVEQRNGIADLSLNYNVFINNAYDGTFGVSRTEYGQVQLLTEVAMAWKTNNKTGHIINIGGVGSEDTGAPFTGWETYNANKAALKHHSLQWSQAFRTGQVPFRTSLITVDRLDTPAGRARPTWTGNGVMLQDVISQVELCINTAPNTCVSEIISWVNLDHKQ
jgi:NAD(P)-dependent dehydrogenase (short-subunit alcohol dehydrogenase family)